jgi:hypothetical protein
LYFARFFSVHNVSPSSNQDGLHRIQVIQRNQEVFGRTLSVLGRGGALHVISTIKSALGEETQDRRHGAIGNRSITLRNATNLVTLPDVG